MKGASARLRWGGSECEHMFDVLVVRHAGTKISLLFPVGSARAARRGMGQTSAIEWTDATWNPWMGCAERSARAVHIATCTASSRDSTGTIRPRYVGRRPSSNEPLRWSTPRTVFTCSWSDWFHPGADAWREDAWKIIRTTPHLIYQILTKRPELIVERLPAELGRRLRERLARRIGGEQPVHLARRCSSQRSPPTLRFVSAEPLLGSLFSASQPGAARLIWMASTGSSSAARAAGFSTDERGVGAGASRRVQCPGIAFFMKQLGSVIAREVGSA